MKTCFLRRCAFLLIMVCVNLQTLFSQTMQISGKITDAKDGSPIIGATVLVKGTSTGVVTNIEGRYTISAAPGNSLIFSYIGYDKQEVVVGTSTTIDVVLKEETTKIEEVVVVGYGVQKKSDVTGAITSVTSQTLREVPVANISQALQGRAAGIEVTSTSSRPGETPQIRIRGERSIGRNTTDQNDLQRNDPLLVLDGIPFGGSINDINPDNIKSLEILKDASATAIYGSRGANGVILITTKRGYIGKAMVSYNGYYGIKSVLRKYEVFDAEKFKELRLLSQYETVIDTTGGVRKRVPVFYTINDEKVNDSLHRQTNWQDLIYQPGYVTNHDLEVSGGTESTQYSFAGGYYDETAIIPGQEFKRYSLRTTIDTKISDRIKIGINSMNTYQITQGENLNFMYSLIDMSPLTMPYDTSGNLNVSPVHPTDEIFNPLLIKDKSTWIQQRIRLRTFNSLYGEVEILKSLKYRLNVGADIRRNDYGYFAAQKSVFRNDNPSQAEQNYTPEYEYTVENILTYDKTFMEKHNLKFTGLYSVQEYQQSY